MTYIPPLDDIRHAMASASRGDAALSEGSPAADPETIEAVLEGAGRFASEILAPLDATGDREGCVYDPIAFSVTTPSGWADAYRRWRDDGWAALPCPREGGGQELPPSLAIAAQEMFCSAASAFGIGVLLTQAAAIALARHGSESLKRTWLEKISLGEWCATMNLTEAHAGSDLSQLRSHARPDPDEEDVWRLFGDKVYITYGEHDFTDNIVHFVLARLPDAPDGVKGLSLFLTPKFILDDEGRPAIRNDVRCVGLERKLGIHASPTCSMSYGGAGEGAWARLVGEPHQGLEAMFSMMNLARLQVGVQGLAIAERAYQKALAYARERRQGRRPRAQGARPIVEHPDVRRMLADMKTEISASRAICHHAATAAHLSEHARDHEAREKFAARAALLIPLAKAFASDVGMRCASTALQVHGGAGFIEETGIAQYYRDSRIPPIYEGANGIQAIDFATRRLPSRRGEAVAELIDELRDVADEASRSNDANLLRAADVLRPSLETLSGSVSKALADLADGDAGRDRTLSAATSLLRQFGLASGGVWLAAEGRGDPDRAWRARYFADRFAREVSSLAETAESLGDALAQAPDSAFADA